MTTYTFQSRETLFPQTLQDFGKICLFLGNICHKRDLAQVSQGLIDALSEELIARTSFDPRMEGKESEMPDVKAAIDALYGLTILTVRIEIVRLSRKNSPAQSSPISILGT